MSLWERIFKRKAKKEGVDELVRQQLCRTFCSLISNEEKAQFIERHSEMLDPFTETFLIETSERQADPRAAEYMCEVAAPLRRSRENGIAQEFADQKESSLSDFREEKLIQAIQKLVSAPSFEALRRTAEEHPKAPDGGCRQVHANGRHRTATAYRISQP